MTLCCSRYDSDQRTINTWIPSGCQHQIVHTSNFVFRLIFVGIHTQYLAASMHRSASVYLLLVVLFMLVRPISSLAVRSTHKSIMGGAHASSVAGDALDLVKGVAYDKTGRVVDCIFCNIRCIQPTNPPSHPPVV